MILQTAYARVKEARVPGLSTCLLLCLTDEPSQGKPSACVHVAIVGDPVLLVLRDNQKLFRTREQFGDWDVPSFLGRAMLPSKGAKSIVVNSVRVKADDVLVVGSDGVFDNLQDSEIQRIVREVSEGAARDKGWEKRAAREIARLAFHASVDPSRTTPYGERALREHGYLMFGGKEDDITVIVSTIREEHDRKR